MGCWLEPIEHANLVSPVRLGKSCQISYIYIYIFLHWATTVHNIQADRVFHWTPHTNLHRTATFIFRKNEFKCIALDLHQSSSSNPVCCTAAECNSCHHQLSRKWDRQPCFARLQVKFARPSGGSQLMEQFGSFLQVARHYMWTPSQARHCLKSNFKWPRG